MSKFADKLKHIYKTTAPSLGFRMPAEEAEPSSLLLVADLTKSGAKKTKTVNNIANAAIVNSESIDVSSFKELATSVNDVPLGLLIEESTSPQKIKELISAGCDFVVFGMQTPLETVNKEGLGKVLKIEPSLTPPLIRAINELGLSIDAVLIAGDNPSITIERLLTVQFFAGLLNKPLLVNVNASLTSSELSSLHGTGVKGLILPPETSLKVFAELKKTINNLPKTIKSKTKTSVLLPHIGTQTETREEDEEQEEEEDI